MSRFLTLIYNLTFSSNGISPLMTDRRVFLDPTVHLFIESLRIVCGIIRVDWNAGLRISSKGVSPPESAIN